MRKRNRITLLISKITSDIPFSRRDSRLYHRKLPLIKEALKRPFDVERLEKAQEVYSSIDATWAEFEQYRQRDSGEVRSFRIHKVVAIAASLTLIGCLIALFLYRADNTNYSDLSTDIPYRDRLGGTKAQLNFGDDSVWLGDQSKLLVAKQQGTKITIENTGELHYNYDPLNRITGKSAFNTLRVPYGGAYRIRLSDGSLVYLNAGSTLKYPVAFTDTVRKIELAGEAYFEVAKSSVPFIVRTLQGVDVRVLGTKFNCSSYRDDAQTITTLLEGSVVVMGKSSVQLKPGQQVRYKDDQGQFDSVKSVDTEAAVSWINGKLSFPEDELYTVIKKIERAYDVSIVTQGIKKQQHYYSLSNVPVNTPLDKLLEALVASLGIHYKKTGNRSILIFK